MSSIKGGAVLVCVLLVACVHKTQTFTTASLVPLDPVESLSTDSAVLARIEREHACPVQVPAAWTVADTTLGSGVRCSLVAAATAAIRNLQGAEDFQPLLRRADLNAVMCVHVRTEAYRDRTSKQLYMARWTVDLYMPKPPSIEVEINRP